MSDEISWEWLASIGGDLLLDPESPYYCGFRGCTVTIRCDHTGWNAFHHYRTEQVQNRDDVLRVLRANGIEPTKEGGE